MMLDNALMTLCVAGMLGWTLAWFRFWLWVFKDYDPQDPRHG
jgi:hypothetical protein